MDGGGNQGGAPNQGASFSYGQSQPTNPTPARPANPVKTYSSKASSSSGSFTPGQGEPTRPLDIDLSKTLKQVEELGKIKAITLNNLEKVAEKLGKIQKTSDDTHHSFTASSKSLSKLIDVFERLEVATRRFGEASEDAANEGILSGKDGKKAINLIQELGSYIATASDNMEELSDESRESLKELQKLTEDASKSMEEFGDEAEETKEKLENLSKKFTTKKIQNELDAVKKRFKEIQEYRDISPKSVATRKAIIKDLQTKWERTYSRGEKKTKGLTDTMKSFGLQPRGVEAILKASNKAGLWGAMAKGHGAAFEKFGGWKGVKGAGGIVKGLTQVGGGSLTKGIAGAVSSGLGKVLAGGGGGMAGGMAGGLLKAAGPIGAILSVAQVLFDKTAADNRKIDELAAGGIYAGNDVSKSMGGYRRFAQSGLMGDWGSNWYFGEKGAFEEATNTMKAIVDNGYALSDTMLQMKSSGGAWGAALEFAEGKFTSQTSAIMRGSFFGSKVLGMDPQKAAKLTQDMMMKYQVSAKNTVVFFDKISKGAKAAGLSTTKYIDIIEGLTGGMDGLNKSFNDIVFTVDKLGRSGRYSADQLQGMSNFLLENKGYTTETSAFIHAVDPAFAAQKIEGARTNMKVAGGDVKDTVYAALGNAKSTAATELKAMVDTIGEKTDPIALMKLIQKNRDEGNISDEMLKSLTQLVDNFRGSRGQYLGYKQNRNNPVGMAIVEEWGGSAQSNMVNMLGRVTTALRIAAKKGISTQEILSSPQSSVGLIGPELLKSLGVDPKEFIKVITHIAQNAEEIGDKTLGNRDEAKDLYEKIQRNPELIANEKGIDMTSLDTFINSVMKMSDKLGFFTRNLPLMTGSTKITDKEAEAASIAEQDKAKQGKNMTRDTADIFATAFKGLFQSIAGPVGWIRDFLSGSDDQSDEQKELGKANKIMRGRTEEFVRKKEKEFDKAIEQQERISEHYYSTIPDDMKGFLDEKGKIAFSKGKEAEAEARVKKRGITTADPAYAQTLQQEKDKMVAEKRLRGMSVHESRLQASDRRLRRLERQKSGLYSQPTTEEEATQLMKDLNEAPRNYTPDVQALNLPDAQKAVDTAFGRKMDVQKNKYGEGYTVAVKDILSTEVARKLENLQTQGVQLTKDNNGQITHFTTNNIVTIAAEVSKVVSAKPSMASPSETPSKVTRPKVM